MFIETDERRALREAVAALGSKYGHEYLVRKARAREHPTELWRDAGGLGLLGVNLPEQHGGGGGGIAELAIVLEELGTAGCPLLMMVVSPAICGTIIARYGTPEQQRDVLPGLADGSSIMAFAITEPDAGSNSHKITTTARRDGDEWVLSGRKHYISGVDIADHVLVVGRSADAKTGSLQPALFMVPTDAPGVQYTAIDMELAMPERQFVLYLDDVRLPTSALVGGEAGTSVGLPALFAGLNPERIMAAAFALGIARYALAKAVSYVGEREVWGRPIGAHQGLAHPLAQCKIEIELARLMMQKAAYLYDQGEDLAAGEAANMAKYAAAEACAKTVDQAVQSLGGHGLATEYGLATLITASRVIRIAPVSREMILNFVAQFSLGLPKSY